MPRKVQKKAAKGSQRWLQEWVNQRTDTLDEALRSQLRLTDKDSITWLSPLENDEYAEYQDEKFLDKLSIRLQNRDLKSFWPNRGPCWDGLAKTSRGEILLIEAKANAPELLATCKAGPKSRTLIQSSLAETAKFYGVSPTRQWSERYYQYANRLAHLYLLRQLNDIPAYLVFIYFVNDFATRGPQSVGKWISKIEAMHNHLGINQSQLAPYVIDLFLDVTTLNGIDSIEKEHSTNQALGTLTDHKISVIKRTNKGGQTKIKKYDEFPLTLESFDAKDALLQALKQLIRSK